MRAQSWKFNMEVVEGMQIDRGYISPYFVTHPEKMEVELDSPLVLLTERKISHMQDLLPLLEQIAKSGRSLVVVAEDLEGEALATLVLNKLRGIFPASQSRPRVSATAARRCCRIWPSCSERKSSRMNWA